jgi:hypothetical protein
VRRVLERAPGVTCELVDGQATLVDAHARRLITLNRTGSCVWDGLDGSRDVDALVALLRKNSAHAPSEQLKADVVSFLDALEKAGLAIRRRRLLQGSDGATASV